MFLLHKAAPAADDPSTQKRVWCASVCAGDGTAPKRKKRGGDEQRAQHVRQSRWRVEEEEGERLLMTAVQEFLV